MSRKVLKKISLSTAVFVCGLFMWAGAANLESKQVPAELQYDESLAIGERPCFPGAPEWPKCKTDPGEGN